MPDRPLLRILEQVHLAATALLVIVIPLAFFPAIEHGFVTPKLVALQTLTYVGYGASFSLWLLRERPAYRPRLPRTLGRLVTVWFVWLTLVTLLAFDPDRSWTGGVSWRNGLRTQFDLLGVAWLVAGVARRPGMRRWLQAALLAPSAPIVVYGFLQAAGIDFFDWYQTTFVFATFGNANYLAGYLVLLLPLTFASIPTGSGARTVRFGLGLLLLAQFGLLVATGSRAGLIGGGVALGLAAVWRRFGTSTRTIRAVAVVFVLLIVATLAISLVGDSVYELAARSEPRPAVWLTALNAIVARPLTGWGLANFEFVQAEHASAVFAQRLAPMGSLWDRTHNLWLERALDTGLPGLLLFGALLLLLLRLLLQRAPSLPAAERGLVLAVVAAIIGAVIQQQTNVSNLGGEVVTWWIVGLGVGLVLVSK